MSFQIIVRQINESVGPVREAVDAKLISPSLANAIIAGPCSTQIYEQTVADLNLGKLIAAVNHKPRKPRTPKAAGSQRATAL